MQLYNELIIPFDDKKNIDFNVLLDLIKLSLNNNNKVILFSSLYDGSQLSAKEKCDIINYISVNNIPDIIIYFQIMDEMTNNILIDALNKSNIKDVFLSPPAGENYNQNGLYLITKEIAKKLSNKNIVIINSPSTSLPYHFQTIKKLIYSLSNLIGIYEDSKDYSLLSLIKTHYPNFKIYLNEQELKKAFELKINGIISLSSLVFGNDFKELINDYEIGFVNNLTLDYLLFVSEILHFNNNSTLLKIYLKNKSYKSMNVRLPLTIDEDDKTNLDFLLS